MSPAPRDPAPVSGPGRFARRTDQPQPVRSAPMQNFGDRGALEGLQGAAPMGGAPAPEGMGDMGGPPIGLFDSTDVPGQPVTAGADMGPGPDSGVLGIPSAGPNPQLAALALKVDTLKHLATLPFASPEISLLLAKAQIEMETLSAPVGPEEPTSDFMDPDMLMHDPMDFEVDDMRLPMESPGVEFESEPEEAEPVEPEPEMVDGV